MNTTTEQRSISKVLYGKSFSQRGEGNGRTRREKKHDMLLTFMAQNHKPRRKSPRRVTTFMNSLLSIFL